MRRPPKRPDVPKRRSDNDKRRLDSQPSAEQIEQLLKTTTYQGSPKHKRHPHLFGLEPFNGIRGDATLCDEHAGFAPADMAQVPALIRRGLRAGLIGSALWTVSDNGWIFEARLTNASSGEHHGYPVRSSEAIAEPVYRRFAVWAASEGGEADKKAVETCRALYGFKG